MNKREYKLHYRAIRGVPILSDIRPRFNSRNLRICERHYGNSFARMTTDTEFLLQCNAHSHLSLSVGFVKRLLKIGTKPPYLRKHHLQKRIALRILRTSIERRLQ